MREQEREGEKGREREGERESVGVVGVFYFSLSGSYIFYVSGQLKSQKERKKPYGLSVELKLLQQSWCALVCVRLIQGSCEMLENHGSH